jgi:hypothetical protein
MFCMHTAVAATMTPNRRALCVWSCLVLALAASGCSDDGGGGDDNEDDAGVVDAGGGTDGAGEDDSGGGAADTGGGTTDTGGGTTDTGGGNDAAAPTGKSCDSTIRCIWGCDGDAACETACEDAASDGAKGSLAAWEDCAVDVCSDVTETDASLFCALGNDTCFAGLRGCANFRGDARSCMEGTTCITSCPVGDRVCQLDCLGGLEDDDQAKALDYWICRVEQCGDLEVGSEAKAACFADKCSAEATACAGTAFDCSQLTACKEYCREPLGTSKSDCPDACRAMADATAISGFDAYASCQTKCEAAQKEFECWKDTCGTEQSACFPAFGTDSCTDILTCVYNECWDNFDNSPACIEECKKEATTVASESFTLYEACFRKALDNDEAEDLGCEFPYDVNTCVGGLSIFCQQQGSYCQQDQ